MTDEIDHQYFIWLCGLVEQEGADRTAVLSHLHGRSFKISIYRDRSRAEDGERLRDTFAGEMGVPREALGYGQCSILELLVAFALRIEENILHEEDLGDRTGDWFRLMLSNLGLYWITDDEYEPAIVDEAVDIFINRKYEYDGSGGGLFVVSHPRADMRSVDLWYQMNWYLLELMERRVL